MENHIGNCLLVGGIPTPLKNMSSSVGVIIPYIMENKTCSKPPTSNCLPTIACSNPDFHYINSECWMVLSCKGFGSGFETWFIAEIIPRFLSNVGSAYFLLKYSLIEGSLEVKLPTIWTVEKQRWEESEEKRSEERRSEEKESEERRGRCAKR